MTAADAVEAAPQVGQTKNPRTAALLSALLPGAGQFYNRKYVKPPVIYAGAAALIYGVWFNNGEYRFARDAYEGKMLYQSGELPYDPHPRSNLETLYRYRESSRKNRDLCYVGLGLLYVLNIIDANVDAHLFDYDVGDDLTLRFEPRVEPPSRFAQNGGQVGMSLSLRF